MGKLGQPDGTMVMPFGKFKGKTIEEIESAYLRWIVDKTDNEELVLAAEAELEFRDNNRSHF